LRRRSSPRPRSRQIIALAKSSPPVAPVSRKRPRWWRRPRRRPRRRCPGHAGSACDGEDPAGRLDDYGGGGGTAGYADGTYAGGDENAYYGRVQVQVTVANHQVASVKVLDYPQDRRTSRYINSQALPMLPAGSDRAQSANIDTVSGATLTSEAYIKSLGSALAQAAGAHA